MPGLPGPAALDLGRKRSRENHERRAERGTGCRTGARSPAVGNCRTSGVAPAPGRTPQRQPRARHAQPPGREAGRHAPGGVGGRAERRSLPAEDQRHLGAQGRTQAGRHQVAPGQGQEGPDGPVRRAGTTSAPTRCSCSSSSSATSAHPSYPDVDTNPDTAGPTTLRRPVVQRDPRAGPHERQLHRLAGGLRQGLLQGPLLRDRQGRRSRSKTLLRAPVLGPLQRRGHGHRLVKVPYNEARYGRSNGYPCASNVCSNTWVARPGRHDAWVADQKAAGTDRRRRSPAVAHVRQSGTATTSTATATSTSPTATSTTSRSSTPAATRPTATRSRARTPSGRHRWHAFRHHTARPAPPTTCSAAPRSATPASGSATTPIQPENGGLSVVAHEYGHDLGLPDHYDTSGPAREPGQLVDPDGAEPRLRTR